MEAEKHKMRLQHSDLPEGVYYSKEFFKDTDEADIDEAIDDIKKDYSEHSLKYQFYNAATLRALETVFERTEDYPLRPNQAETVENFKAAIANGRKNLLMYAVMRFGKSFTAMCCAVEAGAKLVVVVSAKADVMIEWKRTVESHLKFAEYDFVTSSLLSYNNNAITEKLSSGRKVVVFLTLQDLQGEAIKDKHREIFGQDINLLLVDETHFGARAEKYGAVLRGDYESDVKNRKDDEDFVETEAAEEIIKALTADITVHLSGTPYRILMGSEFKKEDIIAFYQFTDIADEQSAWDEEHVLDDDYREWDNPYYGFPQMIRFAFRPNESSRRRLEELKKSGTTYVFSALFKPLSIKKDDNGLYKKFRYEQEISDLLAVIDGSKEDDELLGFLDYDRIKQGEMCRHIVIVLPYCASCDALEELIALRKDTFRNLNEYEIINISGVGDMNKYRSPEDIKRAILDCENRGKKTITLTVNRMLTGSTVPQWDTMLYLKDTASPQEYDQAVFRLQNQYVKTCGEESVDTIKINMKPQTLLVDFDPNRMFLMQERKAKIYNANVETGGNAELEKRLKKELSISPIITVNRDKIERVQATDILLAVSNYRRDKGIKEEALEISVDLSILDDADIKAAIENENEIGAKAGLSVPAHEGTAADDGSELDTPEQPTSDTDEDTTETPSASSDSEESKDNSYKKKIQSFYARILLFAFITDDSVKSLSDIINCLGTGDNVRIARNLGLKKNILEKVFLKSNKFVLSDLDYKIQDLNGLSQAADMPPEERAGVAVNKFGKLGDAVVVTPAKICDGMVDLLPDGFIQGLAENRGRILDIAGTAGEFASAIYRKMSALGIDKDVIANCVYTIPKSSVCYELTRKMYNLLGLNVDNISAFCAAGLLEVKTDGSIDYDKIAKILTRDRPFNDILLSDEIPEGEKMIKFDAIVGNPPFQEIVSKAQQNKSLGKQLFPHFIKMAVKASAKYVTLVSPSKWFTSEGQDGSFAPLRKFFKDNNHIRVIHNFNDNRNIFYGVNLGAVNYFLYEADYSGNVTFIDEQENRVERPLFEDDLEIILSMEQMVSIIKKVSGDAGFKSLMDMACGRNAFGIIGKKETLLSITSDTPFANSVSVQCAYEKIRYIEKGKITKNKKIVDSWKIFTSKGNGAAGTLDMTKPNAIIGKAYVAGPDCACTDSLIPIGCFKTEEEAVNLAKYMSTKFLRFMVGIMKTSRNITQIVYRFVPVQNFSDNSDIDWSQSIPEIDEQLYEKYGLSPEEISFIDSMIKPM